ncbi:hypothetical protein [Actinoplanes sp. NPDC026670]|uniref:hypothetical protein n=1 Tax=Actinoplanes sp. NPDC026670 TaxID=3154700 RepID=UPI0033C209CD
MGVLLSAHVVDAGHGRLRAADLAHGRLGFVGAVRASAGAPLVEVTVVVDVLVVCADALAELRPGGGEGVHVQEAGLLPREVEAMVRTAVVGYLHSTTARPLLLDRLRAIIDDVTVLLARHGDDRNGHARAFRGEAMYRAVRLLSSDSGIAEAAGRMADDWEGSPEELIEAAQAIVFRQGFDQGYQEVAASYAATCLTRRWGRAPADIVEALRQLPIDDITMVVGDATELAALEVRLRDGYRTRAP